MARDAYQRMKSRTRVRIFATATLVIIFFLLYFLGLPLSLSGLTMPQLIWLGVIICIAIGTTVVCIWNFLEERKHSHRRLAMLCQKCGYSLAEIPKHKNGLVICPECGAPWAPEWQ